MHEHEKHVICFFSTFFFILLKYFELNFILTQFDRIFFWKNCKFTLLINCYSFYFFYRKVKLLKFYGSKMLIWVIHWHQLKVVHPRKLQTHRDHRNSIQKITKNWGHYKSSKMKRYAILLFFLLNCFLIFHKEICESLNQ